MRALISAGDAVIAEASGHPIWGIGKTIDPSVHEPDEWTGKNIQGVTLQLVRQYLRGG